MDSNLQFRFAIARPPKGPLVEMSAEEVEGLLLKRLEEEKDSPTDALWELSRFYQQTSQPDKGLACLRQVLARMPDAESKAGCVLAMGQMMESARDFEGAVRFYKEAFALEPVQTDVWYFINNNLGFSLNTLGRFAEAERYCRQAVAVNPNRPNAFKNLGIALAGQGDYAGAARCYVASTQANAADPRAAQLLVDLLREHPELEFEYREAADSCQKAVTVARQKADQLKPVVYRGWRKHMVLLRSRLRAFVSRCVGGTRENKRGG